MAKLGEDRYYKRSGDSFYRMEHFDLEDMFGRRPKPLLTLEIVPRGLRNFPDDPESEELHFYLSNSGRAVAKYSGFYAELYNVKSSVLNVLRMSSKPFTIDSHLRSQYCGHSP